MKYNVINKETGEKLDSFMTNHSMTTEEALEIIGAEIHPENEDENVHYFGDWYYFDDIEVVQVTLEDQIFEILNMSDCDVKKHKKDGTYIFTIDEWKETFDELFDDIEDRVSELKSIGENLADESYTTIESGLTVVKVENTVYIVEFAL